MRGGERPSEVLGNAGTTGNNDTNPRRHPNYLNPRTDYTDPTRWNVNSTKSDDSIVILEIEESTYSTTLYRAGGT